MKRSLCLGIVLGCSLFVFALAANAQTPASSAKTNVAQGWTWKLNKATINIHGAKAKPKDAPLGTINLPMAPAQILRWGPYLYVACRRAGLLVVDVSNPKQPKVVSQQAKGSDVIGVRQEGTLLLLDIAQYKFRILSLIQPNQPVPISSSGIKVTPGQARPSIAKPVVVRPQPRPTPAQERPKPPTRKTPKPTQDTKNDKDSPDNVKDDLRTTVKGLVVRVSRGFVVINKGSKDGLRKGDRIAIRAHKLIRRYDPVSDKTIERPSRQLTAIIVINKITPTTASGQLGRGDRAYAKDFFETTDKPLTQRLFFPTRPGSYWRLRFGLSPIIGVDASAVSFLSFSSISYTFEVPFKIEITMSPTTFTLGSPNSTASTNLLAIFSYNTSYIELMLGIGYQGVMGGVSGMLLMQGIRLGAVDGLNLIFYNQLVLAPEILGISTSRQVFQVGAIHGEINIPLTQQVTLYLAGGGGTVTWFQGTIGIRTYLWGRGGPNTFILSGALGGAGVTPNTVNRNVARAIGPLISAEIDWRF